MIRQGNGWDLHLPPQEGRGRLFWLVITQVAKSGTIPLDCPSVAVVHGSFFAVTHSLTDQHFHLHHSRVTSQLRDLFGLFLMGLISTCVCPHRPGWRM